MRLKHANLASKGVIDNFINNTDFDNKLNDVTSNKNELNELSKKVKPLSTKDYSFSWVKYTGSGSLMDLKICLFITQNCL